MYKHCITRNMELSRIEKEGEQKLGQKEEKAKEGI